MEICEGRRGEKGTYPCGGSMPGGGNGIPAGGGKLEGDERRL